MRRHDQNDEAKPEPTGGGGGHAHKLRNLTLAVELSLDLLEAPPGVIRRLREAVAGLHLLADEIAGETGGEGAVECME